MFKIFKIKNFIKLFVLLFISAMITSCSTIEFIRKPIYSGPIRPMSEVATLLDNMYQMSFHIDNIDNMVGNIQQPAFNSYIYSIDDVIVNKSSIKFEIEIYKRISYDLLPGKHKVIIKTIRHDIGIKGNPYINTYNYVPIGADIEYPAVEFTAKQGVMYCSLLKVIDAEVSYDGSIPVTANFGYVAYISPCSYIEELIMPMKRRFIPEQ